jgi:hypothetical protein
MNGTLSGVVGSIRLPHVQPVLPHLLVQRRPVDVELRGRRLPVPDVALERRLDDPALRTLQRELQRHGL